MVFAWASHETPTNMYCICILCVLIRVWIEFQMILLKFYEFDVLKSGSWIRLRYTKTIYICVISWFIYCSDYYCSNYGNFSHNNTPTIFHSCGDEDQSVHKMFICFSLKIDLIKYFIGFFSNYTTLRTKLSLCSKY